jgi:hypothetical protein
MTIASARAGLRLAAFFVALALLGCAVPRVEFQDGPPSPGYAAFLEGAGHVNPEDPGLPNGGQ